MTEDIRHAFPIAQCETVGGESFKSTIESGSEQSVTLVKTGVFTVSGMNIDNLPEMGKGETSHPMNTEDKFHERQKLEYHSDGIFMKMIAEVKDSKKNRVLNREAVSKYVYSLLEEGSRALISGNFRLALNKHKEASDELQKYPTHLFDEVTKYIWFKYAHFISLIEANNYSDLINAFNSLQELKKILFADMPTYHYAVAKLLTKFNRFHLAEEEIQKCRGAMIGHNFKKHFWLCTEEVIKEATQEGLESYLQELSKSCKCYRIPDATCKFEDCILASSHPYPSREIFHSDPDFKGYVVVICQEGCKVHYHPLCWKNIKETLTKFEKLPDKECLGKKCLTPDCKNSAGEPSVIHKIEIFGTDSHIKSQCVLDLAAEIKQKEIKLKKRQRQISDEHKNDKVAAKNKQKTKKGPEHSESSEVLAVSTKILHPKDATHLLVTGATNVKQNMPAKEKKTKYREMDSLVGQKEFICSYFMMLVNTDGPMSKDKVEEEWEKFYPFFKPMAGLVTKNCGIFNLLKNSSNFIMVDDLLCIKESPNKGALSNKDIVGEIKQMEKIPTDSQPDDTNKEPPELLSHPASSKQPEPSKKFEVLKELKPEIQLKFPIDLSTSEAIIDYKDCGKENSLSDSEISELEKELHCNSLSDQASKSNHNSSELLKEMLLGSPGKDRTKIEEVMSQCTPHIVNKPFNFIEKSKPEQKTPFTTIIDHQQVTGIPFQKSGESLSMMHQHPEYSFLVPPALRPPPPPPVQILSQVPPPPIPAPIGWSNEELQPQKNTPYGSQEMFKSMLVFPPIGGMNPQDFQIQNQSDASVQTEEIWEGISFSDEIWVQHMQFALNELMKKNKDLVKSKEELIVAHQNEVEALQNQMKTLRQSYEYHIETVKESINSDDDNRRRRVLALEHRIKLQEQILNSTKEELRNKDFDLLEAKRLLGLTILDRMESESGKQVTRLVTALASLPCNGKDAEEVGRAMSKWEITGDQASKAKSDFLAACMRQQVKLIDGYGSDTPSELVIPSLEEPVGPCPLDSLALKLLHDKEKSMANSSPTTIAPPAGIPPFRNRNNRNNNTAGGISATGHSVSTSTMPAPLSPVSLGARPRDPNILESSLRKWPSSLSVHSSSGGTSRTLSNFHKLLIELKSYYPSRTEDELRTAIKSARKKNKNTLSGLTVEKISIMVGIALEWWPVPIDGAMGLDKFMGWASDVTPADETFCSISKGSQPSAWMSSSSSVHKECDKEDCCICLQGMSEPKTELICSHSFHTQCIRKWLSKESICPICRKFTRMPDEFPTLK